MKTTIAIADDHSLVRECIANMIESFGNFKIVLHAENGQQLIQNIEAQPSPPDICILDINMPVMNGYDTLEWLKKRWPQIKVIILSMFASEHTMTKVIRNGANGYVTKGTSPADFKQVLEEVLRKGFYYSNLESSHLFKLIQSGVYEPPKLTEKESQFLVLACSDANYKEIAETMNVSCRAIDGYRDSLSKKLGISTRFGLMMYAIQLGIVSLTPSNNI